MGMHEYEPFAVVIERNGDTIVTRLSGDFDLLSKPRFDEEVKPLTAQARGGALVIDLRGLSFMDSTGINALLEIVAESRRDGFNLSVVNGGEPVRRVLTATGVDRI